MGAPQNEVIGPVPAELLDDNLLDFQVLRQMARNLAQNTALSQKRRDEALGEGAFRHALAYWRGKFDKAAKLTRLKYSAQVHQVADEESPSVKDTAGKSTIRS